MTVDNYEVMVMVDVMGVSPVPMARFAKYIDLPYVPLPTADSSQVLVIKIGGKEAVFYPKQLRVRASGEFALTLIVTSAPSRHYDELASRFRANNEWEEWGVPSNGGEGE